MRTMPAMNASFDPIADGARPGPGLKTTSLLLVYLNPKEGQNMTAEQHKEKKQTLLEMMGLSNGVRLESNE